MVRCDEDPANNPSEIRKAVLVVEDEILVRMLIADELRKAGYSVIEASNAHEALEVLRHTSVDVRAIVSDIRMPGSIDGIALARLIRAEHPAIKVVLTSAHLMRLDWAEHDGFFAKPYDVDAVVRHITTLLD